MNGTVDVSSEYELALHVKHHGSRIVKFIQHSQLIAKQHQSVLLQKEEGITSWFVVGKNWFWYIEAETGTDNGRVKLQSYCVPKTDYLVEMVSLFEELNKPT